MMVEDTFYLIISAFFSTTNSEPEVINLYLETTLSSLSTRMFPVF